MNKITGIKINPERIEEIKKTSPSKMPLNPSSQGWSGQLVRKKMGQMSEEILEEVNEKLGVVEDTMNVLTPGFIEKHIIVSETEPEEQEIGGFWLETD